MTTENRHGGREGQPFDEKVRLLFAEAATLGTTKESDRAAYSDNPGLLTEQTPDLLSYPGGYDKPVTTTGFFRDGRTADTVIP